MPINLIRRSLKRYAAASFQRQLAGRSSGSSKVLAMQRFYSRTRVHALVTISALPRILGQPAEGRLRTAAAALKLIFFRPAPNSRAQEEAP